MKPIGMYHVTQAASPPPWVTVSFLEEWCSDQELAEAVHLSRMRGMRWILGLGHLQMEQFAAGNIDRWQKAGLWPWIVAMQFGEEWNARAHSYRQVPLACGGDYPTDPVRAITCQRDWLSARHAQMKALYPWPIVAVDNYWHNSPIFGVQHYRPIPEGVDVVGIDAYAPVGGSFAANIEPFLLHVLTQTDRPIMLIPQWFSQSGWAGLTEDIVKGYARWHGHPRVIGSLGYGWRVQGGLAEQSNDVVDAIGRAMGAA